MSVVTLYQLSREALLTQVENAKKSQAKAGLTGRETATVMLDRAVKHAEVKLDEIGDHGQVSRQIHDKENLSFHHMVATWPAPVMRELVLQMAVHYGFEVVHSVKKTEAAS